MSQWTHLHHSPAGLSELQRNLLRQAEQSAWMPEADLVETDRAYVLRVALAGVRLQDLQLELDQDMLVLRGCRRNPYSEAACPGCRYRLLEVGYGSFVKALPLPGPVRISAIRAELKDGMSEKPERKKRSIPIEEITNHD